MSINVAANIVVRAAQINQTNWDIAAAGTLRIVRTKVSGNNVGCTVFVRTVNGSVDSAKRMAQADGAKRMAHGA